MFKRILLSSALALASSGAFAAASLPWIDDLYNTGEEFAAGETDTRYSFSVLAGTATGTGGFGVVTTGTGFPFGPWLANNVDSKWLAPTANAAQSYDPSSAGQYKWSISFDLTGKDTASAFLAGRWASDNEGLVKLNGSTISSGSSFTSWTAFSADDGFLAGIIIIDEDFRSRERRPVWGSFARSPRRSRKRAFEVLGVTSYGDLTIASRSSAAEPWLGLHPVDRRRGVLVARGLRQGDRGPSSCDRDFGVAARSASATPTSRSSCTARRAPRATSPTTCCARCTASSTCSRTRRNSSRATWCAKRRPISIRWRRPSSARWCTTRPTARTRGTARALGRRRLPEEPGGADVPPVLRREHAARGRVQCGRRTRPAARPHRPGGSLGAQRGAHLQLPTTCIFVTNGTSTSNKMVWHTTVAPGDIVVVDRNCHKSILHSIIMTGAVPVFLTPTRNHYGIIGPIPLAEFSMETIRRRSRPTRSRARRRTRSRAS
jgi:hypothetical protein